MRLLCSYISFVCSSCFSFFPPRLLSFCSMLPQPTLSLCPTLACTNHFSGVIANMAVYHGLFPLHMYRVDGIILYCKPELLLLTSVVSVRVQPECHHLLGWGYISVSALWKKSECSSKCEKVQSKPSVALALVRVTKN